MIEAGRMRIGSRSPLERPVVKVTASPRRPQLRIAFNAFLVRQASLQDVPYMAIEFDKERQQVKFTSTTSQEYQGDVAYRLQHDGGPRSSKTVGRVLLVSKNRFSMLHPRLYEPRRAGPTISIDLEPAPASYADIEASLGGGGQSVLAQLKRYENEIAGILSRFHSSRDSIDIQNSDIPIYRQYVRELIDLFHDAYGGQNNYSQQISDEFDDGLRNMSRSPSYSSVETILSLVKAAQTCFSRDTTVLARRNRVAPPFIAESRLAELRRLRSSQFDFRRLVRFCEELTTTYSEECYLATAVLSRALLDHVPPVFGKSTFSEVANNYGGTRSFREAIRFLESAARKVADAHLHVLIRKNETLPTQQQVNFAAPLDVLLAEIVRI